MLVGYIAIEQPKKKSWKAKNATKNKKKENSHPFFAHNIFLCVLHTALNDNKMEYSMV